MMEEEIVKSHVVGIDVSIAHTTLAILDIRGNILAKDSFPTTDYPNVNDYVTKLAESIVTMMEENGGFLTCRSVGISCPSANFLTGCVANAPNLPWKGIIPLAAMMRDRLGLAVAVANDAHVSALGEYTYGLAHGMEDFIVVSLGVGLGSCFFSHGRGHRGYLGYAGEFGHSCVVDHGRKCNCGKEGCLEAYCATHGIVKTAHEVMAERPSEPSLMRNIDTLTPRIITECCDKGDELAIEVYRRTGYLLGIGLANYASIIDPQIIVLTGGISKAGKWLLDPVRASFEEHVFTNLRGKTKVLVSRINDREREVLGAGALAWVIPEYSLFK